MIVDISANVLLTGYYIPEMQKLKDIRLIKQIKKNVVININQIIVFINGKQYRF